MLNRKAIVARHHPTLQKLDPLSPFTVGNGEFAFTADITGLQTFPDIYDAGMPIHTQSQWGWHSFPNVGGFKVADTYQPYQVDGREVFYANKGASSSSMSPAASFLRANPHRLDLGRIGLILRLPRGENATLEALENIEQRLDLWAGCLHSQFSLGGEVVRVTTVCHPQRDLVAVRIESELLSRREIGVKIGFPYGRGDWKRTADWEKPDAHQTTTKIGANGCDFTRQLDANRYFARCGWSGNAEFATVSPHQFEIWAPHQNSLEFVMEFAPQFTPQAAPRDLPSFEAVRAAAAKGWEDFWQLGGAIDLSQSRDPRWRELERRVVLSQYVTAINCAGSVPPQETGLTGNSWFGKFHLEMHWWHAAHFAQWNRSALLERSLSWYREILPLAQQNALRQGYGGARWPKMVAQDGHDSPSPIAVFLIWQQPHPLYFAELCYRNNPTRETLLKYQEIVFQTAHFMATYPVWDQQNARFVLGPALIPAQESYGNYRATNLNPTYELAYWHWGLETAQKWCERLGLPREPHWQHVLEHLSRPLVRNGVYEAIETAPYTLRHDHPSMLGALGFLPPTPIIDAQIMRNTLESVVKDWDWATTWGWDYPLMAMTAARLGRGDIALDTLLQDSPKNGYLPNGHNYQAERLPLYLPGNGGLLAAIAMMAGGWDGCPEVNAPGFPQDGSWTVQSKGLKPMI